jgi:hypothetical protein
LGNEINSEEKTDGGCNRKNIISSKFCQIIKGMSLNRKFPKQQDNTVAAAADPPLSPPMQERNFPFQNRCMFQH